MSNSEHATELTSGTTMGKNVGPVTPEYQTKIVLGESCAMNAPSAVTTHLLTTSVPDSDLIVAELAAKSIRPSDLRSTSIIVVGHAPSGVSDAQWAYLASLTVAAIWGLARRRPDMLLAPDQDVIDTERVEQEFRVTPDAGRSVTPIIVASAGSTALPEELGAPHVSLNVTPTPEEVTTLRFARRLLWSPPGNVREALAQLVALAGLRVRGEVDRLPALWDATAELDNETESTLPGIVYDVAAARRAGEALRTTARSDNRSSLAAAISLTDRQVELNTLAAVNVRDVLAALEAKSGWVTDESTGDREQVWHCLHPQNHTNGDATPSARLGPIPGGGEGFRCMRCLPERVDSLRLVMWARELTVDDAATWLFANVTGKTVTPVER